MGVIAWIELDAVGLFLLFGVRTQVIERRTYEDTGQASA